MSDCDRLLAALRSGPKTHRELYGLCGVVHSRAAELRARGHEINVSRDTDQDGRPLWVYSLGGSSARWRRSNTLSVRDARRERGWSLTELAARSGLSKGILSMIERGRYLPDSAELMKLSKAFGRPLIRRGKPTLRVAV